MNCICGTSITLRLRVLNRRQITNPLLLSIRYVARGAGFRYWWDLRRLRLQEFIFDEERNKSQVQNHQRSQGESCRTGPRLSDAASLIPLAWLEFADTTQIYAPSY
jgi:hypothetical protein